MKYASQTLWLGIKDSFFQIGRLIVLNVTWLLVSLPIVTMPAATLALTHCIRVLVVDESNYDKRIFWEGFKRYFFSSWRWFLPNLLFPLVFIYNILFFAVESYTLSVFIQAANIVMLLTWFFIQTFTLPFLVEDEQPVMRIALLNSVKLFYQKPALYLLLTMFQFVFMVLSILIITPLLLVSISMSIFISMYCLQVVLGRRGMVPEEESSKVKY